MGRRGPVVLRFQNEGRRGPNIGCREPKKVVGDQKQLDDDRRGSYLRGGDYRESRKQTMGLRGPNGGCRELLWAQYEVVGDLFR